MNTIHVARELAEQAHAGMTRFNKARTPHSEHFSEVAGLVAAHGGNADEIAAAYLHDAVEDTELSLQDIAERTNSHVAYLVDGLTDPPEFAPMQLDQRKPLQAKRVRNKAIGVKLVKVADQTSNLRLIAMDPPTDWDAAKCMEYVDGAKLVVDACHGVCPSLEAEFDLAYETCVAKYGTRNGFPQR